MNVRDLGLDGVKEIVPARYGDARGYFSETYNHSTSKVVLALKKTRAVSPMVGLLTRSGEVVALKL